MHPLVRWQFRGGIEEKNRKAFLFTQPTDGRPPIRFLVLVAGLAASRDVYRVGMDMPLAKIGRRGSGRFPDRSSLNALPPPPVTRS